MRSGTERERDADRSTVALYTDADRTATFVREADDAYPLGPASARPYSTTPSWSGRWWSAGRRRRLGRLGVRRRGPGVRRAVRKIGVTFVGPSAEAMRKLGDKIGSKLIAEEVGVPVAPWSRGEVATLADALRAGTRSATR